MAQTEGLTVAQPKAFLDRIVTVDGRELAKAIMKVGLKVATGQAADAISDLPDLLATVGLENTPSDRAWKLAFAALGSALSSLLREYHETSPDVLGSTLEAEDFFNNPSFSFRLTSAFFDRPDESELPVQFAPVLQHYLLSQGVASSDALNIAGRLPGYFAVAVHNEWRRDAGFYEPIKDAADSPFAGAAGREWEWRRYRAYLNANVDERVFEESFSLRQIYVPLRAYTHVERVSGKGRPFPHDAPSREPTRAVADAFSTFEQWYLNSDRSSSLMVISGGPGSGKSSLSKMIAGRLANSGKRLVLVPLHQIDVEGAPLRAIDNYLVEAGHFREGPLQASSPSAPLLVILDGLDELQMQGKAAQETAQAFVAALVRLIERTNANGTRLIVLLTGRELAIQSAEAYIKHDAVIAHLIPYLVDEHDRRDYADPAGLLKVDQRDLWWKNFGNLTGRSYNGIPDALKEGELGDVTAQPLLNYLVALSYTRGNLSFDAPISVNSVYSDLLDAVYKRAWARNDHPAMQGITKDSFIRLLEEVALSVWHGAGRTTTLREVEEHCKRSKIDSLLPSLESGVSSGVASLLLAFYFRQKGRREDGDRTFEFTHKSFGEYLTALRIVRLVERVSAMRDSNTHDPDGGGWEEAEALYRWASICGPAVADEYLASFVRREVAVRGEEAATAWQHQLERLWEYSLRRGWPMQRFHNATFPDQNRIARNAEEILLTCLNACARVTQRKVQIDWPNRTALGESLKRLQGQRSGPLNPLAFSALSYMVFSGSVLDMVDLYDANLEESVFGGCTIHFGNLAASNLRNADFVGCRCFQLNIDGAELAGTKFDFEQLPRLLVRSPANNARSSRSVQAAINKLIAEGAIVVGRPEEVR